MQRPLLPNWHCQSGVKESAGGSAACDPWPCTGPRGLVHPPPLPAALSLAAAADSEPKHPPSVRPPKWAQFDFLKPTHHLFHHFTALVDAYSKCLVPPEDVLNKLKADAGDSLKTLGRMQQCAASCLLHTRAQRARPSAPLPPAKGPLHSCPTVAPHRPLHPPHPGRVSRGALVE